MAQTTVTVDGVKVASTCPQSAHISIHIHHSSALEQLLGAMGSLKKFLSCPQATKPSKARIHYGQLSLGVRVERLWVPEVSQRVGIPLLDRMQSKVC